MHKPSSRESAQQAAATHAHMHLLRGDAASHDDLERLGVAGKRARAREQKEDAKVERERDSRQHEARQEGRRAGGQRGEVDYEYE